MSSFEDQAAKGPSRLERLGFRGGVLLGLLYLVAEASDLADSSLSTARIAAISLGLTAFVAIYWSLMPPIRWLRCRGQEWRLGALALLPVIAGALLLAGAPSSFTALFIYVVAAAGILLPLWPALAVVATTALGVAIGVSTTGRGRRRGGGLDADDRLDRGDHGVVRLDHSRQPRAADGSRGARAGSPSARSGFASPATCTTCSATACR